MDNLDIDVAINDILNRNEGYDISDVGNEIGYTVAKYFSAKMGWEKSDFISGIKHGISLVDGTHDGENE
jgi:hypothetical protein